jgi:hypothetical protein
MQRHTQSLHALLGALVLSAGLTTPLALADETVADEKQAAAEAQLQPVQQADGTEAQELVESDDEMVEVRISLPSGRTIVRLEPKRKMSARYTPIAGSNASTSRRLADGSRISVASRAVTGGSNSSSVRMGGGGGGGASGGGGSSGGGGAASAGGGSSSNSQGGAASAAPKTGVFSYGPSTQSLVDDSTASSELNTGGDDGAADIQVESVGSSSSSGGSGLGVYSYGTPAANDEDDSTESSVGSDSSSDVGSSNSGSGNTGQQGNPTVPTIGDPVYDGDGNATGGQEVEFDSAGMSAAVIGNTVFFNGVELVSADGSFDVIRGTPIASDTVMLDERRSSNSGQGELNSFNSQGSDIVLELESGRVVEFVMFSYSPNVMNPLREQRTWTVRIR